MKRRNDYVFTFDILDCRRREGETIFGAGQVRWEGGPLESPVYVLHAECLSTHLVRAKLVIYQRTYFLIFFLLYYTF